MHWRFSIYALLIALIDGVLFDQIIWMKQCKWLKLFFVSIVGITLVYGIALGAYYSKGLLTYYVHRDLKKFHFATWYYQEYQ